MARRPKPIPDAKENRESQAVFRCVNCGHEDHAAQNAARNLLARDSLS